MHYRPESKMAYLWSVNIVPHVMDDDESLEDAISSIIGDNYDFLDEKSDCNDYELNYETESVKGEGNLLVTDVVRSWTDIRNPRCEFLIWDSESGEPDPFANFDFSNPDKEALTKIAENMPVYLKEE